MEEKMVAVISEFNKFPQLRDWKIEVRDVARCDTGFSREFVKGVDAFTQTHKKRIVFHRGHVQEDSQDEILESARHEIAHALIAGHICSEFNETLGHCEHWRAMCKTTGAYPHRYPNLRQQSI